MNGGMDGLCRFDQGGSSDLSLGVGDKFFYALNPIPCAQTALQLVINRMHLCCAK
jgi:hypothetical protein